MRQVTIDFEPFKPINTSLYLCDNKFHVEVRVLSSLFLLLSFSFSLPPSIPHPLARSLSLSFSLPLSPSRSLARSLPMCMYMHTHMCFCVNIHIYVQCIQKCEVEGTVKGEMRPKALNV